MKTLKNSTDIKYLKVVVKSITDTTENKAYNFAQ